MSAPGAAPRAAPGAGLAFVKMEGAGNDYVYLDGLSRRLPDLDWPEVARRVADRRFGVGGDGLILVLPGERAPVRMVMFNADGSRGKMCGNGVRCVAKLAFDEGRVSGKAFPVETDSGLIHVEIVKTAGSVARRVRVDMGEPRLAPERVPALLTPSIAEGPGRGAAVSVPIEIVGETIPVTAVSMGNPHCVVFLDEIPQLAPPVPDRLAALEALDLAVIGPAFEHHPAFPESVNTEFVVVESPDRLHMRVWERGSGETWACGTGACASLVASVLTGRALRSATVVLRGGELDVEWREDGHVFMTGPATEVFRGVFDPR